VRLLFDADQITLHLRDNGCGFDPMESHEDSVCREFGKKRRAWAENSRLQAPRVGGLNFHCPSNRNDRPRPQQG